MVYVSSHVPYAVRLEDTNQRLRRYLPGLEGPRNPILGVRLGTPANHGTVYRVCVCVRRGRVGSLMWVLNRVTSCHATWGASIYLQLFGLFNGIVGTYVVLGVSRHSYARSRAFSYTQVDQEYRFQPSFRKHDESWIVVPVSGASPVKPLRCSDRCIPLQSGRALTGGQRSQQSPFRLSIFAPTVLS
jgi:hypothetical protein